MHSSTTPRSSVAVALLFSSQALLAAPVTAGQMAGEIPASDTQRLIRIIEEQQRRLESQAAQLDEQKEALQSLRREVEALQRGSTAPQTEALAAVPTDSTADFEEFRKAVKVWTQKSDWPGSFPLLGSDTRVQIAGFVEFDAMHDSDAILTPTGLVTQGILTRGATDAQGADGQTNFGVQASRVGVETRTPVGGRQLRTFTSVDWFDDFATTKPNMRLREAYGEVSDILFGGDLLFGQTWSTFTNLYAYPNVLDFQGPNALFGTRHPMLRWTRPMGGGWTLKLAAEAPDSRNFEGASSKTGWPDGTVVLGYGSDAINVHGAFLARDLQAAGDGWSDSTLGWAASLQGLVYIPGSRIQDYFMFSLTYGDGWGGVTNDVPTDAVYDPLKNELEAITQLGWFAGYQHWWSPKFYSVFSYGVIDQDNEVAQADTAYHRTEYATANLTWTPMPNLLFGTELMYGSREDKDGATGALVRTQFTSRLSF